MSHTESYLDTATSEMNGAQPHVDYYKRSAFQPQGSRSPLNKAFTERSLLKRVPEVFSPQQVQSGCVEHFPTL